MSTDMAKGMEPVDPAAIRGINSSLTLRALLKARRPLTKTALHDITGLSRRTLEFILIDQIAAGWVSEVPFGHTTGVGRPARSFQFKTANALVAGVQIDRHFATAAVADLHGVVLARSQRVLTNWFNPGLTFAEAAAAIFAVIEEAEVPIDALRAIGVAISGVVGDDGTVLSTFEGPRWAGFSATAVLASQFGVPVLADNDVNLAALAEQWTGAVTDQNSFTWLLSGDRSRAGIVIDDRIHRGFMSTAGEVVYADGFGMQALRDSPVGKLSSPIPEEQTRARAIVDAARSGDAEATVLVQEFASAVTRLLSALAWTIAPPVIVIGGGVEYANDLVLPLLARKMRDSGIPPIELRGSLLGWDAPLLGAVRVAKIRTEESIFG